MEPNWGQNVLIGDAVLTTVAAPADRGDLGARLSPSDARWRRVGEADHRRRRRRRRRSDIDADVVSTDRQSNLTAHGTFRR